MTLVFSVFTKFVTSPFSEFLTAEINQCLKRVDEDIPRPFWDCFLIFTDSLEELKRIESKVPSLRNSGVFVYKRY